MSLAVDVKRGFIVEQAGVYTLIQDPGRFGAHNIGLTTGGPFDSNAFNWANRLCQNNVAATALEIAFGGVQLQATVNTKIAVTGANMPFFINNQQKSLWRSYDINAGDVIRIDYATQGVRCYLSVAGGFVIKPQFGSTSTVCRENIGGLTGTPLQRGDFLPYQPTMPQKILKSKKNYLLTEQLQPRYSNVIKLRAIPSYQQQHFSALEQRLFYSSEYVVSDRYDRMGYRLTGKKIHADIDGILSEGICHGAVQVPADGQPIVLLNDRQTIGGYPKIASVISVDSATLGQVAQGAKIHFEAITLADAHNIFHLEQSRFANTKLVCCD